MKGALDIEFILAAFVFLSTIVFITLSIIGKIPVLQEKSLSENLQSTSYQISEILLTKGYPENWAALNIDSVARVGLESEDYVLDPAKVSSLADHCTNNYNKLREKMQGSDFTIIINGSVLVLNCEPQVVSLLRPRFVTTRHAVYNGELVDMTVAVLG